MKIAVIGLWHLGTVTAACLANAGHAVVGYDPAADTIRLLQNGKAPIFEPGLESLLKQSVQSGNLHYSTDQNDLNDADIAWVTFDTPVDENDIAEVDWVTTQVISIFPYLRDNALLLISSQLPVGSTRRLLQYVKCHFPHKKITFAYSPENLRLGKAIETFTHPGRVIVGLQIDEKTSSHEIDKHRITQLFKPFTDNILWMSLESAEMTKHALNAFLATSVVFINELSTLCERVGANAREVESGLKSEDRIGPKAYLRPGNAIAGGTLARDVNYLIGIGKQQSLDTPLFSALLKSNHAHKQWPCRKLADVFKNLHNKTITMLGLTYKAGTDTLRRSTAVEMCQWLAGQGAHIIAYDPAVKQLPDELTPFVHLAATLEEALRNTDAIIIATEWPAFTALSAEQLLAYTPQPYVFDAGSFLAKTLGQDRRIRYFTVGDHI